MRIAENLQATLSPIPLGAGDGQLLPGSAYQDTSTTNDPGGRIIDLMIRFNW